MKARLLKKMLNNTKYLVSNHDECIAIGSPLITKLISIEKETLKVNYALDDSLVSKKRPREQLNEELRFIWDKLHDLIKSGEIHDIINGRDEIENPLAVFTVKDGRLIESITDKYGYWNTDDNGVVMHSNTHFPTAAQAIEYGINEYKAEQQVISRSIKYIEQNLLDLQKRFQTYSDYISNLESL